MKNYLNFETEIKNLETELEKLKDPYNEGDYLKWILKNLKNSVRVRPKLKDIYSKLDPWQTTMVARHEDRPKSKFL